VILVVAFGVRVSYVAIAKRGPCPIKVAGKVVGSYPSACTVGDQIFYNAEANTIAHGHGFTEPLWSVTHTRDGTEILDRDTGLGAALELLPRHVNFLVGPFVLAAAVVGAITLGRRALWVVAPAALIGVGFLFLAVAGLSLQSRYLVGIAAVAALLAGVSLTGRWRWIGAALLVGAAVYAAGDLADTRERLDDDAPALEELVREAPPCAPVHVPTIRPVPFVAFWAGLEPAQVVATPPGPRGSLVTPTGVGESWIGGGGPGNPGRVETAPPDGFAPLSENETWRIYTKC